MSVPIVQLSNGEPVANDVSAEVNEDGPPIVVEADYFDPDAADTHTFTAGVYSGPGFESGSFAGWTLSQDDLAFIPGNSSPIGRRHAVILSGAGESVYTTLERTFELAAGETLTGFAEFIAGDELPSDDDGYLSIAAAGGDATVLFSASVASVGDFGDSGWVPFEFLAPESGTYILQAGVRNVGDNEDSSQFRLDMPDTLTAVPWVTSNGDGTFNYDPTGRFEWLPEGQTGFDEFAYTVVDNQGASSSAFAEVMIFGANDPAVTGNDTANVQEDGILSADGNVLANDSDIDLEAVLTVAAPGVFNSAYGTLALDEDGSFSYTLNNNSSAVQSLRFGQNAIDSFGYEATDGLEAVPGILNVVIAGTDDAPVANLDTASVQEDIVLAANGNVLANDTDVDAGTALEVATPGVFTGTYGTLTLAGNGEYSYVLNNDTTLVQSLAEGQSVVDTFSYAATDGFTSTPSELRVAISGTNDAPGTENDIAVVQEDTILVASDNVLANDTDIDQETVLTVANAGTYGSLVLSANGDYTYTLDNASATVQALAARQIEIDQFTYVATDGIESTPGLLTVAVIGVNDLPVAQDDSGAVQEDGALSAVGNALDNDADVDSGTILTVAAPGTFSGTYGALSLAADGSFSYLLNNASNAVQSLAVGQAVSDSFGYAASDGIAAAGATLTIDITGANDAPKVDVPIVDQSAAAGSLFTFKVPDNTFSDIDNGDVLSYEAAVMVDGAPSPLPAWLVFDPTNLTFTGTPPGGGSCDCECGGSPESLTIRVTATDRSSASVFDDFVLNVSGGSGEVGQRIIGTNGKDVLTGTDCDDVIEGLKGNDRLTALAGNDRLDGGKGLDVMIGGTGDDTYIVDADIVIEESGGGYDTVFSSASYTLAANVEELVLTGFRDLSGTGNALDNVIVGNAGDNRLKGGRGADVYVYELNGDDDVIEETGPEADTLLFGAGITPDMAKLERRRDDLIIELRGQDGSVTVKGWFASNSKKVESIQFADGTIWGVEEIRGQAARFKGRDGGWNNGDDYGYRYRSDRDDDYYGRSDGRTDADRDHDRGGHEGDRILDSLVAYLADKPHYDFEALAQDAERSDWRGEALSTEEIARRWRQVARYAEGLSHEQDEDARRGAVYRFDGQGLLGGGALGGGFGYRGSTGATRGAADMRTLEGLKEGFHPLHD